jgi:AraC family transcriptional regulator
MNIQPRLETIGEKQMIGKRMQMTFADNKTFELWRSFMQERKNIVNAIGIELYSVEVYGPQFFENFDPKRNFEKWAAVEVASIASIPVGFESLAIPAGHYAIFTYKGPSSETAAFYRYIFNTWLPASGCILDQRPHLACMGKKYRQNDPTSEEDIWIPVKTLF